MINIKGLDKIYVQHVHKFLRNDLQYVQETFR